MAALVQALLNSNVVDPMAIRVQSLDVVAPVDKREMAAFAREVTPGLRADYIERRLETYSLVASAWRGERLRAFQLIDQRILPDLTLTYLGPAFSKVGAYVLIFASLVGTRIEAGNPFCFAVEFESQGAEGSLRRLLPRSAFPRAGDLGEGESASVRALARRFASTFDHIGSLDEERLWTRMTEPMTPASARNGHYQMMVVPCLSAEERVRLVEDLAAGLESFRRRRPGSRRTEQGRAAP